MERNDNLTICVGRQLGSGGRTIAKMLAEQLNCRFFDRELLCLAAKESGFSEKFFEQNDEQKGFFKSLFHMHGPYVSDSHFYGTGMSQENLFKIQSDAIRKAAAQGPCVFVGRCADYILRESDNLVSIFITADVDHRVERLCERMSCSSEEALKMIEKQEASRSSYYNYYTGKQWGHATSYDLCLNSSILGIEGTAQFVRSFVEGRR